MIDTHIHADTRTTNDFKLMSTNEINTAITCSYYPYTLRTQDCLLNLFDRLIEFDTVRAKNEGLDLKVACGIHPENILKNNDKILKELESLIKEDKILAIGEIGLEKNTETEHDILIKQLLIADEYNKPVIIHTPSKNKLEAIKTIVNILNENINPNLVIIDHINLNVIDYLIDLPFNLGLSIQDTYMIGINEGVKILDNYGFDKFLLNSDMSAFPSDSLTVSNFIKELKNLEYKKSLIDKVSHLNAIKFFNL